MKTYTITHSFFTYFKQIGLSIIVTQKVASVFPHFWLKASWRTTGL